MRVVPTCVVQGSAVGAYGKHTLSSLSGIDRLLLKLQWEVFKGPASAVALPACCSTCMITATRRLHAVHPTP